MSARQNKTKEVRENPPGAATNPVTYILVSWLTPYSVLKMRDNDENYCWPVKKTMEHDDSGEQMMVCQGVYISKMKMMKMMAMMKIIVI